ncbi:glycoside hydrolase family 15 protein [Nocardioides acrostichi]|uniref:Glycoside hydrolase family 15 protein n=1 Tax=Nocardioides acrostichi TaxID=2784339 RepID=A0A930V1F2_9ACTN|nr:glycoside hydrolase family 15 protein [Nocardioides acrostichi]MBF4162284.1 glycoside hydrolase family 15 protein [Nocardioides acrostichi]
MALPIEQYALIGDRRTAALVGLDGSIDWLCLPRFDSPACLAALLGSEEHGRWLLAPEDDYEVHRRYVGESGVLETTFTTSGGEVTLIDAMPRGDSRADLLRRLVGVRGTVRMRHEWRVRMDYGSVRPWVRREDLGEESVITAIAGPDKLILRGPRLPVATDHTHADSFEVSAGESLTFSMTWIPSHHDPANLHDLGEPHDRIAETVEQDEAWLGSCRDELPHADVVRRSLMVLRLLTHESTGGIVAAPTTSLPEAFGGERNWDYRYCWLRDAALTLDALVRAGFTEEAVLWRDWLLRAVAGDPEDLQIMYAVDGGRRLPERELDHLPGYADSAPVRVGNGAVSQLQHDVLGEVVDALAKVRRHTTQAQQDDEPDASANAWAVQTALLGELATHWDKPDSGVWEIRGEPRHFVHSKAMVWVAFDRAVRAVEEEGLPAEDDVLARWRKIRDEVRAEILDRGYDEQRGCFTQHYDTDEVDAALLQLSAVGLVDGDDPRMLGTIRAVERDLLRDGLVLRYRTTSGVDGLEGDEHPFLACSFWLVSAYAKAGRLDDAHALLDRLVGLVNDVGLLSEEYDPGEQRFVGNFPQAFSHLALVRAAFDLADAES